MEYFDRLCMPNENIQETGKGCAILETLTRYIHESFAEKQFILSQMFRKLLQSCEMPKQMHVSALSYKDAAGL
jgi:hypothetical protein